MSHDWPAELAGVIASEIRRYRRARRMTAQQLADRCGELGLPIPRAVLANLETGRRPTVSVAELLILARALDVPPLQLVAPVGWEAAAEVLPGHEMPTWDAARWISGELSAEDLDSPAGQKPRRGILRELPELVDPRGPLYPLRAFRAHDQLIAALQTLAASLIPAAESHDADHHARMLRTVTLERELLQWELGHLRRCMADEGLDLPPLPLGLAAADLDAPPLSTGHGPGDGDGATA